jgi:hypothetical protein
MKGGGDRVLRKEFSEISKTPGTGLTLPQEVEQWQTRGAGFCGDEAMEIIPPKTSVKAVYLLRVRLPQHCVRLDADPLHRVHHHQRAFAQR